MDEIIQWEIEDGIGKMILNIHPSNPMNEIFFLRLKFIIENKIMHSDIRALIIYGNGRHYSSGADLDDLLRITNQETMTNANGKIIKYPDILMNNIKSFNTLYNLKIPVISAIKGVCLGSALELALFSHIRICSEGAVLGFPESGYGLIPGCGGILRLSEMIGVPKTMELVLSGNLFSGEVASEYKIVDKILPKNNFIENVIEFSKKIAFGYDKMLINEYLTLFPSYSY